MADSKFFHLCYFKTPINTPFDFLSLDLIKLEYGEAVSVEIPHRKWTLLIGFHKVGFGGKYTVGVNGVAMSALPEAPKTAYS